MNQQLAKLRWRCRRGMKELDVALAGYLDRYYDAASEQERRIFTDLLDLQDPELYAYIIGRTTPSDAALADVIRKLRAAAHP